MHEISWDVLCTEKEYGGYGLERLEVMNDELLGRVAWNVITKPSSICSMVLSGKYSRNTNLREETVSKRFDSELWRWIAKIWPNVLRKISWNVGDGTEISF